MQTFLPYSNYKSTALVLDNKRLNKQILEGYQILKILSGASESGAWRNHPAVLMWKNSETHLVQYINEMVFEANKRGIKTDKNVLNLKVLKQNFEKRWGKDIPSWMQNKEQLNRLTTTHKTNLYRKNSIHYADFYSFTASKYNKPCCDRCLYYWPTHLSK
jgi:hypothetical protein